MSRGATASSRSSSTERSSGGTAATRALAQATGLPAAPDASAAPDPTVDEFLAGAPPEFGVVMNLSKDWTRLERKEFFKSRRDAQGPAASGWSALLDDDLVALGYELSLGTPLFADGELDAARNGKRLAQAARLAPAGQCPPGLSWHAHRTAVNELRETWTSAYPHLVGPTEVPASVLDSLFEAVRNHFQSRAALVHSLKAEWPVLNAPARHCDRQTSEVEQLFDSYRDRKSTRLNSITQ